MRSTSGPGGGAWWRPRGAAATTCALALVAAGLGLALLYVLVQSGGQSAHPAGGQAAGGAALSGMAAPLSWLLGPARTNGRAALAANSGKGRAFRGQRSKAVTVAPALSKQLVLQHAVRNTIIVAFSNQNHIDYTFNWINYIRGLNITNYLVGALDEVTARELVRQGVHAFTMYDTGDFGMPAGDLMFLSPGFLLLGQHKVPLARTVLSYGVDLVLSDVDTVWFKSPLPYFDRYPEADILASSDLRAQTTSDAGLEAPQACGISDMNIGLMRLKFSPNMTRFLNRWDQELQEGGTNVWDQQKFNTLLRAGMFENHLSWWDHTEQHDRAYNIIHLHETNPRLIWGFNQSISVGILPISGFANGHVFFTQRLYEELDEELYVAHANYVAGGYKRHRFRETGLWSYDHQDYYSRGRYVSFELAHPPTPPGFDAMDTRQRVRLHVHAVQMQHDQFWQAAAVAVALRRVLILPKFLCFCDELWMYAFEAKPDVRCRFPGAHQQQLPFICPQDHMLNILALSDEEAKHGPPIWYRESTFLDNPRVPAEVRSSIVTVISDGAPRPWTPREVPKLPERKVDDDADVPEPDADPAAAGKADPEGRTAKQRLRSRWRQGRQLQAVQGAGAAARLQRRPQQEAGQQQLLEQPELQQQQQQQEEQGQLQEGGEGLDVQLATASQAPPQERMLASGDGGERRRGELDLPERLHTPRRVLEGQLVDELEAVASASVLHFPVGALPLIDMFDPVLFDRRRSHATLEAHKALLYTRVEAP